MLGFLLMQNVAGEPERRGLLSAFIGCTVSVNNNIRRLRLEVLQFSKDLKKPKETKVCKSECKNGE